MTPNPRAQTAHTNANVHNTLRDNNTRTTHSPTSAPNRAPIEKPKHTRQTANRAHTTPNN